MKEILLVEIDGKYKYAIQDVWQEPYPGEYGEFRIGYTSCSLNYGNGRTEHIDLPEWWHYT